MPVAAAMLAVGALLGALAVGYALFPEARVPQPPMRFRVSLADDMRAAANDGPMAFSPDGSAMVISLVAVDRGTRALWLLRFDGSEPRELEGTDGADRPFFSPDGRWIAFFLAGELRRVSIDGGPHLPIATHEPGLPGGGAWGDDGRIVFALGPAGLWTVAAPSGTPELLVAAGADELGVILTSPQWAGDDAVLFQYFDADGVQGLAAVSLDTGDVERLYAPAAHPWYLDTGHIAYVVDGTLFVAPFDAEALVITGDPTPMETGIYSSILAPHLAISPNGTLAFFDTGGGASASDLVWRTLDGEYETLTTPQRQGLFYFPTLSPDGTRVAYVLFEEGSGRRSNMIMDLERGMAQEVSAGYHVEWSHDGEDVYVTNDNIADLDIYRLPADLRGEPEPLLVRPLLQIPRDVSPDGEWMLVAEAPAAWSAEYDILLLSLTEGGDPQPLFAEPDVNELDAVFSPDGDWIAWVQSARGEEFEVYVTSFPNLGGQIQISEGGGAEPVWSADGTKIFFRNGQQAYVVDVDTSDGFEHSRPRPLFYGGFQGGLQQSGAYDLSPDGDRILMFSYPDAGNGTESTFLAEMTVIANWFEAVRATDTGR